MLNQIWSSLRSKSNCYAAPRFLKLFVVSALFVRAVYLSWLIRIMHRQLGAHGKGSNLHLGDNVTCRKRKLILISQCASIKVNCVYIRTMRPSSRRNFNYAAAAAAAESNPIGANDKKCEESECIFTSSASAASQRHIIEMFAASARFPTVFNSPLLSVSERISVMCVYSGDYNNKKAKRETHTHV